MKTTPKTLHISLKKTPGGIYRYQGKGGQGTNPGPKYGRGRARTVTETGPRPRFHGPTRAARTAPIFARCPVCPLSGENPGFLI